VDDVGPPHDSLLGPADRERRSGLARAVDRQRTTAAAVIVRIVAGRHLGVPPARLLIDRTCPRCGGGHGKPRLPEAPDLQFSVAYSGTCVVVAVALGKAVGVDVEAVLQLPPVEVERLAAGTLAPEERAGLDRSPRGRRARALMTWWTRKEAVLKAIGDGLTVPPEELVVTPPSAPPRVLRWAGRSDVVDRLSLHALHPPPGHVATLAVLGDAPVRVVEQAAGPLLRSAVAG
jgi:4'-phosphopantetheinyl transferase